MILRSLNAKGSYFKSYWVAHQIERRIENQSAQYQGRSKNPVAGVISQSLWRLIYKWLRSTSTPMVGHSSWDSSPGKGSWIILNVQWGGEEYRALWLIQPKTLISFAKKNQNNIKELWKYSGQAKPVSPRHIILAGNDFTWSKAFPVNQVLMMSEVQQELIIWPTPHSY